MGSDHTVDLGVVAMPLLAVPSGARFRLKAYCDGRRYNPRLRQMGLEEGCWFTVIRTGACWFLGGDEIKIALDRSLLDGLEAEVPL